jgi:hypothetical protein
MQHQAAERAVVCTTSGPSGQLCARRYGGRAAPGHRGRGYRGGVHRRECVESVTDVPWSTSEQVRRRRRRYFLLMGVCIILLALAWTWVRLWSVPLAVGMSAVAAVIPPIAAFVGNNGVRGA